MCALPLLFDFELQESIMTVSICQQLFSYSSISHSTGREVPSRVSFPLILVKILFLLSSFLFSTFSSYHLYSAPSSTASSFMQGFYLKIQHSLWSELLLSACLLYCLVLFANHTSHYRSHLLLGGCCQKPAVLFGTGY